MNSTMIYSTFNNSCVSVATVASASIGLWWIGLILVLLIILLIIILLCCLIRRNRGESYPGT